MGKMLKASCAALFLAVASAAEVPNFNHYNAFEIKARTDSINNHDRATLFKKRFTGDSTVNKGMVRFTCPDGQSKPTKCTPHVTITSGEGDWFDCTCHADDGSVPVQVLVQCIKTEEHGIKSMPHFVTKNYTNCEFKSINTADEIEK